MTDTQLSTTGTSLPENLANTSLILGPDTIQSAATLTLDTPLTLGTYVLFENSAGDSGALVVTPDAFQVTTLVTQGTPSGISAALGGNIEGFLPGDTIVLQNLDSLYAELDFSPSAAQNNASFNTDIALLATAGAQIIVNPDGSADAVVSEFGESITQAIAGSIQTYLDEIRSALFETAADTVSLTISLAADPSSNYDGILTASAGIIEVTCFCAGTNIATPEGDIPVEQLKIGDLVQTLGAGCQKIKFIGRRDYSAPFANHPSVLPIRIQANALANGIPARDLFVSPGHAIGIDGVLVHAARLVNGVSITQLRSVETVSYFHIELETHEIILAEDCPAETFIGERFRAQFHNAAEFAARYPGQAAPEFPCLPLLENGFHLHAIQRRLAARAGIDTASFHGPAAHKAAYQAAYQAATLRGFIDQAGPDVESRDHRESGPTLENRIAGWAQYQAAPEQPVSIEITIAGRRAARILANHPRPDLNAAGLGSGYHGFETHLANLIGPITVQSSAANTPLPHANPTRAQTRAA